MSTASRVIKNTGWLYARMGITMIISLLTTRLVLQSLGASDFGIYNVVGGAIAMLGFVNAAMAATTQRFLNYSEGQGDVENKKSIFNVSLVLHFGISLVMMVVLLVAGFIYFRGILNIPLERVFAAKVVYACLVFSTAITIITVPFDALLTSHENMRFYAIVGVFESILKLSIAFACVYTIKDKLVVYGALMSIIPLIYLMIMWAYCKRHYSECVIAPRRYYSHSSFKQVGGFAGWNFAMTSTSMLTQYGLGLVLNSFFSVVVNAAHGIANQLSGMLSAFSSNAQKAYNPVLVKSEGAGDREKVQYISLFGCRISFFIFGFFAIPAILMMPEVLKIWLKDVPEWAIVFSQLQLIRTLLEQLNSGLYSAIQASGQIRNYCIASSSVYALPLIITPILFRMGFPPYWMYIVWIICWPVAIAVISLVNYKKIFGMPVKSYFKQVWFPSVTIALISIVPYIISSIAGCPRSILHTSSVVAALLFFLLGWFFILQSGERRKIINMVSSMFSFSR